MVTPPMSPEALALSGDLARELGQFPLDGSWRAAVTEPCDFIVYSRSRAGKAYPMALNPDGYAVHQGEGCEGEIFNGPIACWHSRSYSTMTTAVTPYNPGAVAAPLTFDDEAIAVLKNTIAKGVSDTELQLFIATCQRTRLDPFARQIYAIQRRTKEGDNWVNRMTIQIGIDGMRLIAERTGKYAGGDGPQWSGDGQTWLDAWTEDGPPAFARYCAWRKDVERGFIAVARYKSYVQTTGQGAPTSLWAKMPDVMLGKCAESLALRRAFPAEMSGFAAAVDQDYDAEAVDAEVTQGAPWQEEEAPALPEGSIEGDFTAPADEHGAQDAGRDDVAHNGVSGEAEATAPASGPANHGEGETGRVSPPSSPAPPADGDAMPKTMQEYRAEAMRRLEAAGHDRDTVEVAAQQRFGNRPFGQLSPKEIVELAADHGVTVALPGQAALVAAAGAN